MICDVYCYSILPNHFHFLLRLKTIEQLATLKKARPLSQPFNDLFNAYAKSFNKRYQRKGTLFMRAFKRIQVETDSYFSQLIHYIHANPVHHGYCKTIEEWEFSSYKSLLSDKPTRLLRKDVIEWFGNAKQFEIFHQQLIVCRKGWEFE